MKIIILSALLFLSSSLMAQTYEITMLRHDQKATLELDDS